MAKNSSKLNRIIKRYRAQLESMDIQVEQVMLYGSHAVGNPEENSDIDLIIISKDWEKFNDRERLELLGIAAARILEPVQAYGFTPAEIEQRRLTPFWEEIVERQAISM